MVKRHFTGRPVNPESESDSDSEDELSRVSDEELQKTEVGEGSERATGPGSIQVGDSAKSDEEEPQEESDAASSSDINTSGETSGESSSDDEEGDLISLPKPVFLSKKQRVEKKVIDQKQRDNERVLKTIEMHKKQDAEMKLKLKEKELNLGGIDDTDGLNPEEELRLFEERKKFRYERERKKLEQEQEELEDLEMRRLRTEEEIEQEYKENKKEAINKSKIKGAFFQDEKLLSRKLEGEIEKYDKSLLPQRYDPKKHTTK